MTEPTKSQVQIARGNIYLPSSTYEKYLKNIESVALLPNENGILLIPLIQESAGGLLLKIKNLQGDRIVHAQEFFRFNNFLEEFQEKSYDVRWETERAALLIIDVARAQ
ncbi:hypothetical protein BH10ACI1_BH10ACI1_10210 [soil metagenome]